MYRGYVRREEKKWQHTRELMAYTLNFSGFGARDITHSKDLVPLDLDKEQQKRMITSLSMAMDLLKEFKRWQG